MGMLCGPMRSTIKDGFRLAALASLFGFALAGCAMRGPSAPGEVQSMSGLADLARIRGESGLVAMTPDPTLERAAAAQAGYMAEAGRMEHTTGWGRDFASRMKADGITTAAENVAHAAEMEKVFAMWARSPPHRRNMLDPRFSRFGLASAPDGRGKRYWALVLGR